VDTTPVMVLEIQDTTLVMEVEIQAITLVLEVEAQDTTLVMEVGTLDTTLVLEVEAQAITLVLEVEIPDIIPDTTVLHLFQEMAIVITSVAADKSVEAMEEVTGEVMEEVMEEVTEVVMDADQADLSAKLDVTSLHSAMEINGNLMVETVSPVLALAGDTVITLDTTLDTLHTHHTLPSPTTLAPVDAG